MANTYSQIYLQFVFAVRNREALIPKQHKDELHRYLTGLVQNRGAKSLAVHCMPDHVHLFVGFKPVISISDFVKEIKVESNEFINSKGWIRGTFRWQEGFGMFSYSHSHIDRVIKYINNQEAHHAKTAFRTEYLEMLSRFEVSYDEKYVFVFFDRGAKEAPNGAE
jgi:putative transposase